MASVFNQQKFLKKNGRISEPVNFDIVKSWLAAEAADNEINFWTQQKMNVAWSKSLEQLQFRP